MTATPKFREAQQKLKEYIFVNRLQPGDRLPVESELASAFGMSRLSLREAVKGLETVGVVKTTQGGGTFVQPFSFAPILENLPYAFQLNKRDLRNLLELRAALEEGLVARAGEWFRRRQLDDLRLIANEMAKSDPGSQAMAELDRTFHLRLYEPLDNPLISQMIDLFWQMFHRLHLGQPLAMAKSAEVAKLHLDVVDAIAAQDGIVESMTRHFEDIRQRLDAADEDASLDSRESGMLKKEEQ